MQSTSQKTAVSGLAWDLSTEYPSLGSREFLADYEKAQSLIGEIERTIVPIQDALPRARELDVSTAAKLLPISQKISLQQREVWTLIGNVTTYAYCEKSVDSTNSEAKSWEAKGQALHSRVSQAGKPLGLFLTLVPDSFIQAFLDHPELRDEEFSLRRSREQRDFLLSLPEEQMIEALRVDGHSAWNTLHSTISSQLKVEVESSEGRKSTGFAQAAGMLSDPSESVRKSAWLGIQRAWESQQETCSAALNAIAGWRIELNRKRSHTRKQDFLDPALFGSRIRRETLDALMGTVLERQEIGRRAVQLMAKVHSAGKGGASSQLDPWNVRAPLPHSNETAITYEDGSELVRKAFHSLDPEMGKFAQLCKDKRWVEGRTEGKRSPGGYCTKFVKSRTPRIYMTYNGSMSSVFTLAHELGHAFHNWVMRDLPLVLTSYPMTLAETASIFAETLVKDAVAETAGDATRKEMAWQDLEGAYAFLVDIPARYDFEYRFYEARKKGMVSAEECRMLMTDAWKKSHGGTMSQEDSLFWASKLHFYIWQTSFYNFPYTFGYLFSLGVYAQRKKLGSGFFPAYVNLLRDTGRMTAEEVAAKHLGVDLTKPDFWRESLDIVRAKIDAAEKVLL